MKIAFYAADLVPFHSETLNERPLGGTETGVIRLADALSDLQHEVYVFNRIESAPPSKVKYLPIEALSSHQPFDVLIVIRDWLPLLQDIPARRKMLWTGESYDQFSNFGIGDRRVVKMLDALLAVSEWQAKELSRASNFPLEKIWVLGNGVHLPYFEGEEKRVPGRLIYTSTPHRGLSYVPDLYQALKKHHPEIELKIFSSFKVYDDSGKNDQEHLFATLKNKLAGLPDVSFSGSVTQRELSREFMRASILFYPCDYEETSCITVMEAQAAGCVVLSSQLGALPETVGDAGILVPGRPRDGIEFLKNYITAANALIKDKALWKKLSDRSKERAQGLSWRKVAEKFDRYLRNS